MSSHTVMLAWGLRWFAIIGLVTGIVVVLHAPRVAAAADAYPFATVPCIHAPYAAESPALGWCDNYDFGPRPDDTSAANLTSPYGYAYRNCTDYVAWKLARLGVSPQLYKGLHHAKFWATPPSDRNLRVNTVPAAGAVAVRQTGTYGHLAFVEEVLADGRLRLSQFNKHGDGNYSEDVGRPSDFGFDAFVHFEEYYAMPLTQTPSVLDEETPEARVGLQVAQSTEASVIAAPEPAPPDADVTMLSTSSPSIATSAELKDVEPVEPALALTSGAQATVITPSSQLTLASEKVESPPEPPPEPLSQPMAEVPSLPTPLPAVTLSIASRAPPVQVEHPLDRLPPPVGARLRPLLRHQSKMHSIPTASLHGRELTPANFWPFWALLALIAFRECVRLGRRFAAPGS